MHDEEEVKAVAEAIKDQMLLSLIAHGHISVKHVEEYAKFAIRALDEVREKK